MIESSFLVALALLVWFDTDAFNEYCKLLKLDKFFYLDQFNAMAKEGGTLSYPEFLAEFHNSFFTRLVSCPICSSIWLSIGVSIFSGFSSFGVTALLGLTVYKITSKLLSYA